MTIRGIFFDLGGTLFDYPTERKRSGPALVRAMRTLAGGGELDLQQLGQAYGQANREIAKRYAAMEYYLHADLFRDTFKRATELLGVGFDESAYDGYRIAQHADIVEDMPLKADCIETLHALRGAGHYLSIVSNIDEDMLHPLVEREGLESYLHHWTSSEAAGSCKPHARFFEVSLEKSGLKADEVLFVGDSPEHDVNGASAVGMRTVLIRNGEDDAPLQSGAPTVEPDHVIRELGELKALLL